MESSVWFGVELCCVDGEMKGSTKPFGGDG